tara:strand:- start:96 stop:1052 length:957 start_codon:yes stop_codon:yes gene_type:complete
MSEPLFSIVITNFNKAGLIEACLRSAIEQTISRERFEVVVVDDMSTDHSLSILSQFKPGISVVENQRNSGALISTLSGVEAARGSYIVTLDGDDILANNLLEVLQDSNLLRSDRFLRGGIHQCDQQDGAGAAIEELGLPVRFKPAWKLALEAKTGGSSLVFPRQALLDLHGRFPPIAVQDHAIPEMLSLVLTDYLRLDCYTHFANTGCAVEHLSGNSAQLHHDRLLCGLAILQNAMELRPLPYLISRLRRRLFGRCLRYVWKYQLWGSATTCRLLIGSPSLDQLSSVCHQIASEMRLRHPTIRYYGGEPMPSAARRVA